MLMFYYITTSLNFHTTVASLVTSFTLQIAITFIFAQLSLATITFVSEEIAVLK